MLFTDLSRLSSRESLSKKRLLLFHWFACSIGLIGIIYGLSWKLHAGLLAGRTVTKYNQWAVPFFFPNKPQQLIFFIATGIGLFIYYVFAYYVMNKRDKGMSDCYDIVNVSSKASILIYISILVGLNAIIAASFPAAPRPRIPLSAYALIVLWLSAVLLPFYPPFSHVKAKYRKIMQAFWQVTERTNEILQQQACAWLIAGLLSLSCIQLVTMFLPFLRGELLMMNEYLNVPERTLMDGKYVSNTEYINNHNLGGLLKYDPDANHGISPMPRPGTFVELPKTELLGQFIKKNRAKYYYDDALHALVIHRPMTAEERTELSAIVDHEYSAKIVSLYYGLRDQADRLNNRIYTSEEREFLWKNRLEMHWQILSRWVIHHHNFVLGPINEYALGKPLKDINIQYGVFNMVLMTYVLEKTGGITYDNYFKKWYMAWPLYYTCFIALTFLIFRDIYYVALVCILAFGFVNAIDYQFLFLGPGLNPIRHFFDIPLIACMHMYFKGGKRWLLVSAAALATIAVLNNQQFGLFLVGSFFMTLLVKAFLERGVARLREVIWGSVSLAASGVIVLIANLGKNEMASYYFEGFLGNIINPNRLILMILVVSLCYIILLKLENTTDGLKYTGLFLLVYSQAVLIYYIWGGDDKHLFNVSSILVLTAATFLKLIIDHTSVKRFEKAMVGSLILLALTVVYIPGLLSYYAARQEYEEIFVTHKTYDWNLDRAQFRSTMDPAYFADSISLIHAYAPSHNAIHLISKYDNFLPFLAKKYSAMPFFDLQWFLLTDKEVNRCIERIKTQKPPYLFVDTDIERNFNGEIVTVEEPRFISGLVGESLMRVQRLNLLSDIFRAVKEEYEPVKQGMLLTVYKRRSTEAKAAMPEATLLN
jgi:hypothetical protein